jgi:hypothetical protein
VPGGHTAEINNWKGEDLEVVEHLRREGCVWETQLQTKSIRSYVKLCQVGIEHMHSGALGRTLLWVLKKSESLRILDALPSGHWEYAQWCWGRTLLWVQEEPESLGDSESSAKWALSRCKECTEDRTVERSVKRYSARWALRHCADRHSKRRELFEFWNLEEESMEGSSQGCWTPWRLSRRLLEQEDSQEGIKFSICGRKERKRTEFLWRSKLQESLGQIAPLCACEDFAEAQKSNNPLGIQG